MRHRPGPTVLARVLALALVAVGIAGSPSPALGAPSPPNRTARPVPSGTTTVTVVVDGTTRDAVVHVPERVAADPRAAAPLVLHLHGGLGSPEHSIATTGLIDAAERAGFVVAFPRGTAVDAAGALGLDGYVWNAGRCCGLAARESVDDVAFLETLVDELEETLPVDASRVVMSGHSNGAMMTWRFACEAGGVLAAAMPVAGSLETADPASCAPRATLLAVHGDADRNHPIGGGSGERSISRVAYRPFAESVAAYAAASGCRAKTRTVQQGVATVTRSRGCAHDASVESVVLAGADHPWPGGGGSGTAVQGTPFPDWSATDALVDLVRRTE
jgi:polyhydroxybutyrate depolymerase